MAILLASGSPQRASILTQLGLPFRVRVPDVEELDMGVPGEVALENARRKSAAVLTEASDTELVLAVDTLVDVDGIPFGKPETAEDAFTMLALLRGRTHDVVGGIVLAHPASGAAEERVVRTKVRFRDFPDDLLERYVAGEEWRERAGGYAIQGTGAAMVSGIGGDYQNVVGLPVSMLLSLLETTEGWDALARGSASA